MAKKLLADIDRYWQSVHLREDGCLEWQKFTDKDGYGQFKVGSRADGTRRMVRAHRWAYEHFVGPIPDGMQIDHLCRNRKCVNHEHLEIVTGLVNTQRGWRATKLYCKHGHQLFGENLGIHAGTGFRFCKECQRRSIREFYRRSGGAAQKKYADANREERRLAQARRRASWTPEEKERRLARARELDAVRRMRKKLVGG